VNAQGWSFRSEERNSRYSLYGPAKRKGDEGVRGMTQGWLIIERLENWEFDASKNFAFFGLKSRYRKVVAEIKANDSLICYVSSGYSAFSDIRIVQDAELGQLKDHSYDRAFPHFLSTTSVLVLPREKWVALKEVAPNLDLTKGRTDYRSLFQTSIRKLTEHDSTYLQAKVREAAGSTE
jgi:hypothetical protein